MKRSLLIGYQVLTGLSDTSTGILLLVAPGLTLELMKVRVPVDALPFLSYIGAFVLSVGIVCLYGAVLATGLHAASLPGQARFETVWLTTGITRAIIAVFVLAEVSSHRLEPGWSTVAITDGVIAIIQFFGLARGWVRNVYP